jgi:hypothetical protein
MIWQALLGVLLEAAQNEYKCQAIPLFFARGAVIIITAFIKKRSAALHWLLNLGYP